MISRLEELKLLAQCALADNRDAFGRLVEAYQPRVRRFLLNLTHGDESLTDDLAQETFLKAYLAIRNFRGVAAFSTWLYRIAINEFYSHTRRRREESLEEQPGTEPLSPGDQQAVDSGLTLRQAMRYLSENEQLAVTLFYIEDQPLKKVAAVMNQSEGTVKSHLHRARRKLANVVGNL